jgi:CRP/FNR family transcriptional regulator
MKMNIEIFNFTNLLNEKELKFLKSNLSPFELHENTILFYQNDICENILLLEKGDVSLYIYADASDKPITLYTIKAGEQCIINTASAISGTPVIANAMSTSSIKGYMMPVKVAKELMHLNEQYQNFIFSLFALKFHSLTSLIEDIKFKKLDARVLALLTSKNESLVTTTHEQLAQSLSSSRVVISKVLKELENRKKIKLHRGQIEIL